MMVATIPWHHVAWLWLWFTVGMLLYMLKRAYYLVTGPNPVAKNYHDFIVRCWIPLLVRASVDAVLFWVCFNPQLLEKGMAAIGWTDSAWVVMMVTQFAPCAFLFGHTIDSFADVALSKIPVLKDILPQMPGPLPPTAPA